MLDIKKNMSRDNVDEAFLNQYEVDRRSIYVRGFPVHTTEENLRDLFGQIGTVVDAQLRKSSTTGASESHI